MPNYGPVYIRLCKDSRCKPVSKTVAIVPDMMAIDYDQHDFPIGIELLGGFCIEAAPHRDPASSSPSSKQEDDPANYPDPRFKWDGKPVEVRGSVVWFKPAGGNGEHGWGQFNPYEAKRLALFINSAIAPPDSKPPTQSEDHIADAGKMVEPTKPTESVDECGNCGAPIQAPTGGKMDACLTCQPEHGMPPPLNPLKQVIENDKRQSVQSEGKVRWFKHKTDKNMVWESVGSCGRWHHLDGSIEESGLGIESFTTDENYEEFFPTQPKDSKAMGSRDIVDQIHKTDNGPAVMYQAAHVIDDLRSALKSANERAEKAEKKIAEMGVDWMNRGKAVRYVIAKQTCHGYAFAPNPKVHFGFDEALPEATRLANQEKKPFTIFRFHQSVEPTK